MNKENINPDEIGAELTKALQERAEILYQLSMREKFSRRKNANGSFTYQDFLNKLGEENANIPVRIITGKLRE